MKTSAERTVKGGAPLVKKPKRGFRCQASSTTSDRLHGNCQQIVHQADFFLDKRLGVAHSGEQPVVAGHGGNALANLGLAWEQLASLLLVLILRPIRHQRGESRIELLGDIHHECRPNVGVKDGVDDLVWPMRRSAEVEL